MCLQRTACQALPATPRSQKRQGHPFLELTERGGLATISPFLSLQALLLCTSSQRVKSHLIVLHKAPAASVIFLLYACSNNRK